MSLDRIDRTGFATPRATRAHGRRCTAVVQLITSAALVLCTGVAATAVSIGIARADVFTPAPEDSSAHVGVLLALVLVVMGGLTAWMSRTHVKAGE